MTIDVPGYRAGTWNLDPAHSEVTFSVRHMMISKVRGTFGMKSATLVAPENPLEAKVEASVDVTSVDTKDEGRDTHLRSADFFDTENSGPMTFTTTSFDGETARGELSIKGITKPVELEVEFLGVDKDPWGGTRLGFEASTVINRKDWGVDFNIPLDGSKVLIGDKVNIHLAVEAVLAEA